MLGCALHNNTVAGWAFRLIQGKSGAALAWLALVLGCASALAQSPPAPAAPDPTYEAARQAFEAMPTPERSALQDALVWSGDYASTTTGAFGRRTYDGIRAFQKRTGRPQTGLLDPAAVRDVTAVGARARAAAGFASSVDGRSGAEIGIPAKLLPKAGANPSGGSRWQSRDDRITLDTRALPGGEPELKDLYERNLAIATPGRTVTYKLSRPDMFVVTGETGTGRFYMRYAAGPDGIRGFTIGYDKALVPDLEKVVVAISNSFVAFPAAGSEHHGGAASAAAPATAPPAAAPPREPASFTGLIVGPRAVLTSAEIDGCPEPQVAGQRARVGSVDRGRGLARLDLAADRRAGAPNFTAAEGADRAVLFVASEEGGRLVVAPAVAEPGGRLAAPLQPGAGGAVVLDRTGGVVGMVGTPALGPRAFAGLAVPTTHAVVPAADLAAIAGAPAPPPAPAGAERQSLGALASAMSASVVAVTCARPRRP